MQVNAKNMRKLQARIVELEAQLKDMQSKVGIRSDNIEDRYTHMGAAELRIAIIKRNGNPNDVVEGFHSRQRSIKMREWLRAHSGSKRRLSERDIDRIVDGKPKKVSKAYNGSPVRKVGKQKKGR